MQAAPLPERREALRLPFPAGEYAAKLADAQEDLASRGLSAGLISDPENIFWLTGYRSIGYWTFQSLFVPAVGRPVLVSRVFNRSLALALPTIERFAVIGDTEEPAHVLGSVLAQELPSGGRVGIETAGRGFTPLIVRQLERDALAELVDWNGFCEGRRRIKTPDQLDRMRHAARAAVAGLDEAIAAIAPGQSENDVAAAMLAGLTRAGSEFVRVPLVAAGPASALCFTTWERRIIEKGDVVLVEDAACIDRYHAAIGRTCVVGPATAEHRHVASALIEVLNRAIDVIKPGVTSGEVHAASAAVLERHGLAHHRARRLGYGIGIGFPPNWAEGHFLDLKADDPTILEPGMTFHVIPSLFTDAFGMWFSESLAVTDTGCEVLTDYPRKLIELDF